MKRKRFAFAVITAAKAVAAVAGAAALIVALVAAAAAFAGNAGIPAENALPAVGDSSMIAMWILLAVVALGGIIGVTIAGRRRK